MEPEQKQPSPFSQFCLNSLSPLQNQQSPQGMDLDPFNGEPVNPQLPLFESSKLPSKQVFCKCRNTHCLKLYCDCFSRAEYCLGCGCIGCKNVPEHEEERRISINEVLERNPKAFHRMEGVPTVRRGCNCKKSGCQKKYCECFSNGLGCIADCNCDNCLNGKSLFE